MNLLLDTNAYRDFCEGRPAMVSIIQKARTIALPFVVLAELRAGFACGTLARRNEGILVRFLNASRVRALYPDENTTHHFGRLYHQLRKQGTPIPAHDIWIAALAAQHDLLLASRDRHFDHLPQLARVEMT
jgi:tRNA(fMet)-specific endonuclease VapC